MGTLFLFMKQYIFKVTVRNSFTQAEEIYYSTGLNINRVVSGLKDSEILEVARIMEETAIASGIFKAI